MIRKIRRESNDNIPKLKRNINDKYEAYLDYYGKPYPSDDPADYYEISLKGAIIA